VRELISTLQTTWPHIRFALYRRDDGYYQFFEQLFQDCGGGCDWQDNHYSGLYADPEAAKLAMVEHIVAYHKN
jgi:hypothetical protein